MSPERFHEARISLQPFSLSFPRSFLLSVWIARLYSPKDNHGVIIASPNVCKRIPRQRRRRKKQKQQNSGRCSKRSAKHNASIPCLRCFHNHLYKPSRRVSLTTSNSNLFIFFFSLFLYPVLWLSVCTPPNHTVLPMPWPNNRYGDFFLYHRFWADWR